MLVYANTLKFEGKNSEKELFCALAGWFLRKTGKKLRISELKKSGKFNFEDSRLSIETATETPPYLYSLIFKHGDNIVRGRQWIVEIGIQANDSDTLLTCVVRTDEISSLIRNEVEATRPNLIKYAVKNSSLAAGTPGHNIKKIDGDEHHYKALLAEIEYSERNHPLLLISPKRDGEYLMEVDHLQENLLGLAQLIKIEPSFNSYEMSEILSRRLSCWDGAINIIHAPFPDGRIVNHLYRSDEIESWGADSESRIKKVMALVTHNTNIPKLHDHIRPEGVRIKALRENFYKKGKAKSATERKLQNDFDTLIGMAAEQEQQYKEDFSGLEFEKLCLEENNKQLAKELSKEKWAKETLKHQLSQSGGCPELIEIAELLAFSCRVDEPTPEECISLVGNLFPEKCIILDSAVESSKDVVAFKRGRRLLDMLRRLVLDYRDAMIKGGDNEARVKFTNKEYSSNESETVTSNPALRRMRTFNYKGEAVSMFRHLRVGVADNTEMTIRVHFYWDGIDNKIVIGYCGKHLPISKC